LYPPPSLLAFAPLAVLTYEQARLALLAISHLLILAMIAALIWWVGQRNDGRDLAAGAMAVVMAMVSWPLAATLEHGQINVVVLALIVAFWYATRRDAPIVAGACLALATLFKTYPAVIVLALWVSRRRDAAAWTLLWLLISALMAAAVLPAAVWSDWRAHILPTAGYGARPEGLFYPGSIRNLGLNGLFARWFSGTSAVPPTSPTLAASLTYAAAAAVMVVTAIVVHRLAARDRRGGFDRAMVVTLPAVFLMAPFSWEHHLVFLLPSVLMLLLARATTHAWIDAVYLIGIAALAAVLALQRTLPVKAYAVVLLWLIAAVAATSARLRFPFDRMVVRNGAG
jgi:alpha-1,2-mannosyltransferase